ncbi:hypothetical protein EG329_003420 [Mollisiaceae sp. DMI_Dod_QoI]|nr:hypothetical protein EG329_003420 [Helotiales sp. DMI_Dod_QoI]
MIELDHSALPQSEPEPALPILASHLLQLEEKQRARFTGHGRRARLSTDCEDINEMLGGGIERGIVMGISGEGAEGRLISLHLLASALVPQLSTSSSHSKSSPRTKATIIDTTGSFPLSLLAQILKSRITNSHALTSRNAVQTANHIVSPLDQPREDAVSTEKIEQEVQRCLEMVAISRVFDIEGLWEVLGEVGRDGPATSDPSSSIAGLAKDVTAVGQKTDGAVQSSPDWPEISDSQEEDLSPIDDAESASKVPEMEKKEQDEGTEIIIIDNMTQIINELFSRKEKGTLFTQFPSLHIFHSPIPKTREDAEVLYGREADDAPLEPGMVGYCTVVEVLKDETANLGFGADVGVGKEGEGEGKGKGRRFGWREQRWCAVEVWDEDGVGVGLRGAFGMGMERRGIRGGGGADGGGGDGSETLKGTTGTETGVGNVAKIYGFGGRRV